MGAVASAAHRPSLLRRRGVGMADVVFVVLLLRTLSLGQTQLLRDPDTTLHVRAGQIILQQLAIPRTDPFTYTHAGAAWIPHQWLAECIGAAAYALAGWNGVVLLTAGVLALTYRCVYRMLLARGSGPVAAAVLAIIAAGVGAFHWHARPHVVTLLFSLACYGACERYWRGEIGVRRLARLVPLFVLWANVHPGWMAGGIILACSALGLAIERSWRKAGGCLLVGLACAAATMVNPFGWELHRWLLGGILGKAFVRAHVHEYQPLDPRTPEGATFAAFLVLLLAVRLASRYRMRPVETLNLLVWLGLGYASRNVPILALVATLQLGRWLQATPPSWGRVLGRVIPLGSDLREAELARPGGALSLAAFALVLVLTLAGVTCRPMGIGTARFDPGRWPVGTAAYLRSHSPAGPGFHPDGWGAYLAFHVPGLKTFMDSRFGMYEESFLNEYLAAVRMQRGRDGRPAWRGLFDRYAVRWALLPRRWPLARHLEARPEWRRLAQDDASVLLVRSGGSFR